MYTTNHVLIYFKIYSIINAASLKSYYILALYQTYTKVEKDILTL